MIHRGGLTLKSEVSLDFATRRGKSGLLLLSPNEIEDLLLARGEFSHRCSAEHYTIGNNARKEKRSAFDVQARNR